MKTYKELQEKLDNLSESSYTVGGAARGAHSNFGVHRVEHPEQVGRLNAFLNSFTQMEFLDPRSAVAQLRHKFNLSGLEFEWNNQSSVDIENTMNIPLERWGGSFGTIPTHNLMKDGVFAEMHLVLCRNVLIYFDQTLQNRVLNVLSDSLTHRGFLMLGDRESIEFSCVGEQFEPHCGKNRIYRKKLFVEKSF